MNFSKLNETLMVYPIKYDKNAPTGKFVSALFEALKKHPSLNQYVDITLTIDNISSVEITFIETIGKRRRSGHAGAVFSLMTDLADLFDIKLSLQAYYDKSMSGRKALNQQQLEDFYGRRGFKMKDFDKSRAPWMTRMPSVHENSPN